MIKIAIITTLPPINTSLSEYGKFLVEGLLGVSEQCEIFVLADKPVADVPIEELALNRLHVNRCWDFNSKKTPLDILNQLKKIKPDLVIFNLQFASFGNKKIPAMLGLGTPLLARQAGYKVVTILHNMIEALQLNAPYFAKNNFDKWLIKTGGNIATRLLLQSHKLIVTLNEYKDILSAKYKAKNVDVIGLGTYIEPAEQVQVQKENRFLTFGKFGAYKKLDFILDVFEDLLNDYPDIELIIGGADHPNHPGYLQAMENKYQHLRPNVKFIGWIEDEHLADEIARAKAVILSYEATAGSSGPLHLSISQGKPVVAPDIGDFVRVAENEDVDILFYKHQNMLALRKSFVNLIEDRVDIELIGQHNLAIASRYSSHKTAQKYWILLKEYFPEKLNSNSGELVEVN